MRYFYGGDIGVGDCTDDDFADDVDGDIDANNDYDVGNGLDNCIDYVGDVDNGNGVDIDVDRW